MPDTFAALCNIFFDSLEYDYGITSIRVAMQKLFLSQEGGMYAPLNATTGEAEIVRQIYGVLPEHCTPPEYGVRIQLGSLCDAVQARYLLAPASSPTNECN